MEHWFDRLSAASFTRRTALQAAGLGIAGLSLPALRPGRSAASATEACYPFCLSAAFAPAYAFSQSTCQPLRNRAKGTAPTSPASRRAQACTAKALADYKRGKLKCGRTSCGDPQTYPGGDPSGFGPTAGGCPPGTTGCIQGDCCCAGGSACCPCAATGVGCICCVTAVTCAECCPGG